MPATTTLTSHAPAWKVWSALSIVYVVWGSTYLGIRIVVETMPSLLTAGARFLVAGAIMFAIGVKVEKPRIATRHWKPAFIIGTALLLGGNGGVVLAEETVSSGIAALMVAAIPLWLALQARLFLSERIGRRAVAGIIIGFAGIAILSWPSGDTQLDPKGAALLLFAPISWAAGSLYSKRAKQVDGPLTAMGMQMLAGGVSLMIAAFIRGEFSGIDPQRFSTASWVALGYLIAFGSLAAFTAYMWLLQNAPTSLVGTYAYVNPVVAIFLGWAVLSERLTAMTGVAAAVIVVGVALMVTSPGPRPLKPDQPPLEAG